MWQVKNGGGGLEFESRDFELRELTRSVAGHYNEIRMGE